MDFHVESGALDASRVYVLAGPSGVGKGTVVQALKELYPDLQVAISATTRAPRPGEIDGVSYHFVSSEQFDQILAQDGFLEWAEVHGLNRYGTLRSDVYRRLAATSGPVLLEIDLAGARQIKKTCPGAKFVFLSPPSMEELCARLFGRGTESEEERARRMRTAEVEMAARDEFDYVVVNNTVQQAARELASVLGID